MIKIEGPLKINVLTGYLKLSINFVKESVQYGIKIQKFFFVESRVIWLFYGKVILYIKKDVV